MHLSSFSLGPSRGYQFLILTFYVPLVGPRTFMRYNVPTITWQKHQSEPSANSSRQNKRHFCAFFRQVKSTHEVGVECQKNATGEGYAYRYVTSLYNLVSGPLDPKVEVYQIMSDARDESTIQSSHWDRAWLACVFCVLDHTERFLATFAKRLFVQKCMHWVTCEG